MNGLLFPFSIKNSFKKQNKIIFGSKEIKKKITEMKLVVTLKRNKCSTIIIVIDQKLETNRTQI